MSKNTEFILRRIREWSAGHQPTPDSESKYELFKRQHPLVGRMRTAEERQNVRRKKGD